MSRPLFVLTSLLLFCAGSLGQTTTSKAASTQKALVAHAQEYVDTWNKKNVKRMRQLHAPDVASQLYGIGDTFMRVDTLLEELAKENFWNASWSLKMMDPRVRMLGSDAAFVAFRLVGKQTDGKGVTTPYSAAFTLVYQRQKGAWKIVHVQDSSPL